jgi:protein gp37
MADKTGISWTDATWNPVRGCSRVSEGCRNCYAERVAARFSGPGQPYEGLAKIGVRTGHHPKWTGEVRMVPDHLADPLRWRKPRRVFVNSMSDLFHEKLTNEQIAAVFGVMAAAPQHTFQALTKRAKRMREWFAWIGADAANICDEVATASLAGYYDVCHLGLTTSEFRWPLPNVWLGVSVENQAAADERIPELLATPAAVRFLSCEPLLGPLDLRVHLAGAGARRVLEQYPCDESRIPAHLRPPPELHWLITGCESGPGARACQTGWLRSLRDQCRAVGVPYFLKQAKEDIDTGRVYPSSHAARRNTPIMVAGVGSKLKAGGVIELPYLDGAQHAAFPEVSHG